MLCGSQPVEFSGPGPSMLAGSLRYNAVSPSLARAGWSRTGGLSIRKPGSHEGFGTGDLRLRSPGRMGSSPAGVQSFVCFVAQLMQLGPQSCVGLVSNRCTHSLAGGPAQTLLHCASAGVTYADQ